VICAATLLAEIGDCRARYPNRDAIAADAGQAPVAVESGKRKSAKFRWRATPQEQVRRPDCRILRRTALESRRETGPGGIAAALPRGTVADNYSFC